MPLDSYAARRAPLSAKHRADPARSDACADHPAQSHARADAARAARRAMRAGPSYHSVARAAAALALLGSLATQPALAAPQATTAPHAPPGSDAARAAAAQVPRSDMDARLFYEVLVGEMQLREGQPSTAYEIILDAARRTKDEQLFQRAVEIAVRGQSGEQALAAARAWRVALPQSRAGHEYTAQILLALGRPGEAVEPLRDLLRLTPQEQLPGALATIPRLMVRVQDRQEAARYVDEITTPFRTQEGAAASAWAASGWGWLAADDSDRALEALRRALGASAADESAGLLAVELTKTRPAAEELLQTHLQARPDSALVRLAYARRLIESQRLAPAAEQLEVATKLRPEYGGAWITLGAVRLDLKQPAQAEAALNRYLALRESARRAEAQAQAQARAQAASAPDGADTAPGTPVVLSTDAATAEQDAQAYLLLAQAAEQRGNLRQAQSWLDRIPDQGSSLLVQMRRASLLARQGRLDQGLALLQRAPAATDVEERARFQAQSALLREAQRWQAAYDLLQQAVTRFPQDADLLYEQAMVAEKLRRYDDMERLLRRIIEIDPKHYHAHNALGFSLADRGLRLEEARRLIVRALELSPGDPFITDSLGWVEFRQGRLDEARRLLQQAYDGKPDPEIAAHLGEVLWAQGQRDEARRIWREGQQRDPANQTLRDTLKRLKVRL